MKKLINISVSFVADIKNQRANCGEKFMGNESLVKKHEDKAYLSAQTIRHSVFDTMESINRGYNDTIFSTPDSAIDVENPKEELVNNIAYDFRGTLMPGDSFKRYSTVKTNHSFAMEKSSTYFDLLLQFKNAAKDTIQKDKNQHNIVKNEISHRDKMVFNFSLDVERVFAHDEIIEKEISKDNIRIIKSIVPAIEDQTLFLTEKKRRLGLYLKSLENLHGFANQSRNLIDATPKEMFIVFNHITHDNKFLNFFEKSIDERIALLDYCKSNDIDYIIFDKTLTITDNCKNIYEVFSTMIKKLDDFDLSLS
jgi:CRISPR-associated protein Cas7/Csp1